MQEFLRLYGQITIIGVGSLIGLMTVLVHRVRTRHNRYERDS